MIRRFIDTYYLLALLHPNDEAHGKAKAMAGALTGEFVTTQWVLAEVADGCTQPQDRVRVVEFLQALSTSPNIRVIHASNVWFERGLRFFGERADKAWSLTDCISFLVMEEENIYEALTADHHFEQAGFVALLKEKS